MYFIEQLQDLFSVCLGFIAEVIGLLILGGVAVRSMTIAHIVPLWASFTGHWGKSAGRQIPGTKQTKKSKNVGWAFFPLNCLSHATYSFPGYLWSPNIIRYFPSLMHELGVGLWFLHLSKLSVQSSRCSERAIFCRGSCREYRISIYWEIYSICSLLQPS